MTFSNDEEIPDANNRGGYVGSFSMNDVTTAQYPTIDIVLPNAKSGQEYELYFENLTDQSLPALWDAHITPKTVGPHA